MLLIFAVIGVSVFVLSYAVVFKYLPKKLVRLFAVLVTCIWLGLGAATWLYAARPAVRVVVDTFLRPATQHTIMGVADRTLPLPPKTTLRGRHSYTGANYYTRLPAEEIISFYKRTSQIQDSKVVNGVTSLTVSSDSGLYEVIITPEGQGTNIRVEGK